MDEQIVMELSDWILPIITVGTLIFFYINYLLVRDEFKKTKIYFIMIVFGLSIVLNLIWITLGLVHMKTDDLFVQFFVLGVMVFLMAYSIIKRKR